MTDPRPVIRRPAVTCLCALLWLIAAAHSAAQEAAETAPPRYVGGSLWIGLHESGAFDSAILARLATGTPVVVVEQENGLAKVRTEGGDEGWVDAAFLVDQPPVVAPAPLPVPIVDASRIEAERDALAAELADVIGQRDALAGQLEGALAASEPAAPAAAAAGQQATNAAPADARAKIAQLTADNGRLREAMQELLGSDRRERRERSAGFASLLLDPDSAPAPWQVMRDWGLWMYVLLGSVLLFALCAGAAMVQWDVRRRHGGFRV